MTAAAASRRGDNRELVALARGGGLNFIGAAITQLTTVGLLLYMTRDLSKTDVGLFRISVALFELLMIVALLGLGQAMTRYVAVFRADRDRAAVLGTIRLGLVVTTVSSVLVGALLFLASPWLSNTRLQRAGASSRRCASSPSPSRRGPSPRSRSPPAPASGPCGRTP